MYDTQGMVMQRLFVKARSVGGVPGQEQGGRQHGGAAAP